jgi:hypothetical protein
MRIFDFLKRKKAPPSPEERENRQSRGQPRIEVLGVHRLEVDDSLVQAQNAGLIAPQDAKRQQAFEQETRDWLESTVLVEVLVTNRDQRFDPEDFTQDSTKKGGHISGSMFDVRYLTPDGTRVIGEDMESLPEDIDSFRVAMYLRCWDQTRPLLSTYGELKCPAVTDMPERLQRLASYYPSD